MIIPRDYKLRLKAFKDYECQAIPAETLVSVGFSYDSRRKAIVCSSCQLCLAAEFPEYRNPLALHRAHSNDRCPYLLIQREQKERDAQKAQTGIYLTHFCLYLRLNY